MKFVFVLSATVLAAAFAPFVNQAQAAESFSINCKLTDFSSKPGTVVVEKTVSVNEDEWQTLAIYKGHSYQLLIPAFGTGAKHNFVIGVKNSRKQVVGSAYTSFDSKLSVLSFQDGPRVTLECAGN